MDNLIKPGDRLSFKDYAEAIENTWFFSDEVSEMRFLDRFNADRLYEMTLSSAAKDGVTITDADECDYETFFWEMYKA